MRNLDAEIAFVKQQIDSYSSLSSLRAKMVREDLEKYLTFLTELKFAQEKDVENPKGTHASKVLMRARQGVFGQSSYTYANKLATEDIVARMGGDGRRKAVKTYNMRDESIRQERQKKSNSLGCVLLILVALGCFILLFVLYY